MMKGNSSALRHGRYSEVGRVYLVTFVTRGRQKLFDNFQQGRLVVDVLRAESVATDTLAFVVMPDHAHWLLQLREKPLSKTVQTVKSLSARRLNQVSGCLGSVWQNGFHDHAVRKDEDLVRLARYVVMNPVRAGLVKTVREYSLWDAVWL
ncbi:REP-associated tyrosine transposase [Amphritea sp. HPY]|uniref:REP-associated tyrosine transposase n=1 Tax=Amphritea sp. HPY TaxID=3421652 RepID=UPI003D7D72C3